MVQPYNDYLLLEVLKVETGIISSAEDTVFDRPQKGKVLAIGDGYNPDLGKNEPSLIKVGEIVYWHRSADADTPPELVNQGQVLVRDCKIMGIENNA